MTTASLLMLEVKMKSNWKFVSVLAAALTMMFGVSNVFAQYGSGACDATCDVPSVSYAPTCEAPSCEPTCDVGYGSSVDCGVGYYGDSCYNDACYPDLCGLITGVLNVAASPFKWVYCELTNGIYPDCGCAPRPEKQACNPCNICGDYVGGCNDNCESFPAGNCYPQNAEIYYQDAGGYYPSPSSAGSYSSAFYDVEQYDASPTRGGQKVPTLPINGTGRNDFSMRSIRNFDVQDIVGNTKKVSNVRSVSYEQQNVKSARPVQTQVQLQQKNTVRNVQPQTRTNVQNLQNAKELQKKQNVRIVAENNNVGRNENSKAFGKTRSIK
jgi:hypothetical protein